MKKFIYLFVTCVVLNIYSCTVDEEVLPGSSSDAVLMKCTPKGAVFTVIPNNDNDTENLLNAFELARIKGPNSVVQLVEGTYHIDFMEIREFKGYFKGAGKGKTIITPLTGLDGAALTEKNLFVVLIAFIGGNVNMSDMTIQTPPEVLCLDGGPLTGLLIFSDYSSQYVSIKKYIKATVNNVEFIGQWLGSDWNCYWGIIAYMDNNQYSLERSHEDIKITNCYFDNFAIGADLSSNKQGNLILGTKGNGNVFKNCGWDDAQFCDNINVNISVVGNKFNVPPWCWGLYVDNYPFENRLNEPQYRKTMVFLKENEFNLNGGYNGLFFHDHRLISNPEENYPMFLLSTDNVFNMSNEAYSGMWIYECKGPVICNNKFTGTGSLGIDVSPSGQADCYAEYGKIAGNNFANTTFSVASVRLGEWSKNWTVIGRGLDNETIIDLGVDNVIKGMHEIIAAKSFTIPPVRHPALFERLNQ